MNNKMTFVSNGIYTAIVDEVLGVTLKLKFIAVEVREVKEIRYIFEKENGNCVVLDGANLKGYFSPSSYKDI